MAYNTPPTKSPGDTFTAAEWNTYMRDNQAAGVPDQFAAAGDMFLGSGANAGIILPSSYSQYRLKSNGVGSQLSWTATLPQVRLSRSTAQSIANNTATEITFTAEDADTDDFYPGSGTTITIPNVGFGLGLYLVTVSGYWSGHVTTNKLRQVGVSISGVYRWSAVTSDADASPIHQSVPFMLNLSVGTTLAMAVLQVSGGSLNFNDARMEVARLL